jgi:hypothetical protein
MYDSVMPYHEDRLLPQFTLREIDLPQVTEWEVNGEYYIVMKVKMVSKRNQRVSEAPEDRQRIEGDFEMRSIKALGDKPIDGKRLEQEELEKIKAKALSGE